MKIFKTSQKRQIYDFLRQQIESGKSAAGDRLASIKDLASQLETSPASVQQALGDLERDGFILKKHGSGCYVADAFKPAALSDAAAIAVQRDVHLFGELALQLAEELQNKGRIPVFCDSKPEALNSPQKLAWGGIESFFIDGSSSNNIEQLRHPIFAERTVIGLIRWDTDFKPRRGGLVLTNLAQAASEAVEYLSRLGHKKILITGTETAIAETDKNMAGFQTYPHFLANAWRNAGGEFATLRSYWAEGDKATIRKDDLLKLFASPESPTAVAGCRDLEAWLVQDAFLRNRPELLDQVDIIGYGDTPWSQTAFRPITSITLNIQRMAVKAVEMMRDCAQGSEFRAEQIPTSLIERTKAGQPN